VIYEPLEDGPSSMQDTMDSTLQRSELRRSGHVRVRAAQTGHHGPPHQRKSSPVPCAPLIVHNDLMECGEADVLTSVI
jgi:hypothetical protein